MSDGHQWRQGDRVLIAVGSDRMPAVVILASRNGKSLMLEFEAVLHGHVGTMPVLQEEDGSFRSVVTGEVVELTADDR
jgi:hypothetical protein